MSFESDVQALVQTHVDGWNQHDAAKCASVYSEDSDVTSWQGATIHGRAAVAESYKRLFAGRFRTSQRTSEPPKIRLVTPAIASVDIRMKVSGVTDSDNKPRPDRPTLVTWLVQQGATGWTVVVAHEGNLPKAAAPESADPPPSA
jgi:uncharacterized protein (TIGR02246 family)